MTLADYSIAAFALLNGGRTVAYFPQMIRVYRDPRGDHSRRVCAKRDRLPRDRRTDGVQTH